MALKAADIDFMICALNKTVHSFQSKGHVWALVLVYKDSDYTHTNLCETSTSPQILLVHPDIIKLPVMLATPLTSDLKKLIAWQYVGILMNIKDKWPSYLSLSI